MRHPGRTALAAVSLLIFLASAVACIVSYFVPFGVKSNDMSLDSQRELWGASETTIALNEGTLYLHRVDMARTGPAPQLSDIHFRRFGTEEASDRLLTRWLPYKRVLTQASFKGDLWVATGSETERQWTLPLWVLVPLLAILPIRWAILRRRGNWRNAAAVCVRCGYDLRASRDRCPECGTPVPAIIRVW